MWANMTFLPSVTRTNEKMASVEESDALETLLSQLPFPTPPTTSLHEMGEPTTTATAPSVNNHGVSMSFQQRLDLANVSGEFSSSENSVKDSVKFIHPQKVG